MTIRPSLRRAFVCTLVFGATVTLAARFRTATAQPLVLGAAPVLGYVLIRRLVGHPVSAPLASLKRQTAAAARGDLSKRVNYPRADDFIELAADINRLIKRAQVASDEAAELQAKVLDYQHDLERERSYMEEQIAKRSRDLWEKTEIASRDALTGLINRREGLDRFSQLWLSRRLHGEPLACIMLDIDHFKSFNDTYGHAAGDTVLQEVAAVLRKNVRATDTACRVGGEEFLILCPQGGLDGAAACAEHLRAAVQNHAYKYEGLQLNVTVSLGVAERTEAMAAPEELLNLSDECLYLAKRSGRNRVIRANQLPAEGVSDRNAVGQSVGHFRAEAGQTPHDAPVRILLAEQDAPLRRQWTQLLGDSGMEVVEVGHGHDVLSVGRESPFDVLILDAELPGMSGLECVKVLKDEPATAEVPTLLVVPPGTEPAAESLLTAGADDLLVKPLGAASLILRAESLARSYRAKLALIQNCKVQDAQKSAFSRLYSFSQSLSRCPTLDDVLEKTLSVAAELTQCNRVCVMMPDPPHENLVMARAIGLDAAAATVKVPIGKGLAGRVYRSKRAVSLGTADDVQRMGGAADAVVFTDAPLACCPMSAQSQTVGVLGVSHRKVAGPFDWQELEFLSQISNMAASAIADIISRKSRDDARDAVVEALGTLAEYRDDNTGQHLLRVTQFSLLLAETLRATDEFKSQIDDQFLSDLLRAVPLHDIGKVGIPDKILLKNRKLTREEMTIMKRHVDIGVDTIESVRKRVPGAGYLKMAQDIAAGHHEWYNGAGYPKGLMGAKIPLAARIVALADVYDALTTERPYKPAYRHADAAQVIYQSSAIQFDPAVVAAFRKQEDQFATLADALSDHKTRNYAESISAEAETGDRSADDEKDMYELAPLD